jgi:hypothetical protein
MARGHLAIGVVIGLAAVGFGPPAAADAGVSVRFGGDPASRPFPSDRFTVPDWDQVTFHRVNLPKPDCAARPTDCDDIELLNTLDGFNTQPRVTIPFTGDIDPATVSSDTVYLLDLGDVQTGEGFGQRVGINQAVWDVASRTAPNPTNSALLRTGDLADRATFYRHDLAYALNPTLLKDPHTFLTSANAGLAPIGLQAVVQIAVFLGPAAP